MTARVDPGRMLGLLERGERASAEEALRAVFAEGRCPRDAEPEERLSWMLLVTLDRLGTEPSFTASTVDGGREYRGGDSEAVRGILALEAAVAASDRLRSGRIAECVERTLEAERAAPASMPWIRFTVASLLQACFRFTGDPTLLTAALDACGRLADEVARPYLAVQARGLLGSIHLLSGAYHATVAACDAGLELADATGLATTAAPAMAHQFRGYVLFEWNRLSEAGSALDRAWKLAGEDHRGVRSGVARIQARLAAERGDRAGADVWLDRLEDIVKEPMTLRNREWLRAVRVGHGRGRGDVRALEEWLRTYDYRVRTLAGLRDQELAGRLHELNQVLAMLEATEQWQAVRDVAAAALRGAGTDRCWFAVRALSADAVALEATGRRADADIRWCEALATGAPGSFVRVYLEGSGLRLRLLERAAESGDTVGEARRVLEAARVVEEASGAVGGTLTPRQLAVLERVARGGSNKTVARELGLSLSTVKTHLREAYSRLGASSRTQAVSRARERGWL